MTVGNYVRLLDSARLAKECANDAKGLHSKLIRLVSHHRDNGFDAIAGEVRPDWVQEDEQGNLSGMDFSRAQYLAMVEFAEQLEAFIRGQTPTPGNYRAIVNRVANA